MKKYRDYTLTTEHGAAHIRCTKEFATNPERIKWLADLIEKVSNEPVPEHKKVKP